MLEIINEYHTNKIPCLFIIDFLMEKPVVIPIDDCADQNIWFYINGKSNNNVETHNQPDSSSPNPIFDYNPVDYTAFKKKFDAVMKEILRGNTYLLNLSFETNLKTDLSLEKIFEYSRAKYKLLFGDEFVVFSPETFITINDNIISTFPMKGTIDASIENAEQILLNDKKESAELATITDLLRNDLSKVASDVKVTEYKHIDKLITSRKTLLQQSAVIRGIIHPHLQKRPGDILEMLLPAGSISGAPKKRTIDIIRATEDHNRGYYTGIFGYSDGEKLESGVMIRFIEKRDDEKFYKSGSGITFMSDPIKEYNEIRDKIYVPIY